LAQSLANFDRRRVRAEINHHVALAMTAAQVIALVNLRDDFLQRAEIFRARDELLAASSF